MKRKAIQLASQTIVVSLPAKWVKEHGVKKGDEIEVEETNGKLMISSEKIFHENKKIIQIDQYGALKRRIILSYYLRGIDELELQFIKPEYIKDVKNKITNNLIGFEIIKQTSHSLTLKDIGGFFQQDFMLILRRIFLIIESMANDLLESLKKKEKDLTSIISIDKETNKMAYFSIRVLNKGVAIDYHKIPLLYSIILCLENIGDLYKYIARDITQNNIKPLQHDIEHLRLINTLFVTFREVFFDPKNNSLIQFVESYENVRKKVLGSVGKRTTDPLLSVYFSQLLSAIIMMNNNLLLMV